MQTVSYNYSEVCEALLSLKAHCTLLAPDVTKKKKKKNPNKTLLVIKKKKFPAKLKQ